MRRLAEEVQRCESEISECKDKLVEALKKSPSVTFSLCRTPTSIRTPLLSWRGRPSPKIQTSTGSICLLILLGYLIINAESHRCGGDGAAGESELQLQANRQFHVSGSVSLLSEYRVALLGLLCSQKQLVRPWGHVDCLNFSEDESRGLAAGKVQVEKRRILREAERSCVAYLEAKSRQIINQTARINLLAKNGSP